jgi:hypothetical protein
LLEEVLVLQVVVLAVTAAETSVKLEHQVLVAVVEVRTDLMEERVALEVFILMNLKRDLLDHLEFGHLKLNTQQESAETGQVNLDF